MTLPGIAIRPAVPSDLDACAEIWRAGLDGYGARVGRPPLAAAPGPLVGLLGHLRATDPRRFLVAVRVARGASRHGAGEARDERIVAFVAALQRAHVWFLAMLFVHPEEQARGLGRRLLEAVLPSHGEATTLATCTDAAQPVSSALYARYGIVPRLPILELVGRPDPVRLPALVEGVRAVPFELLDRGPAGRSPGDPAGDPGRGYLADAIAELDGSLLGYAHPLDHAYLATSGRLGYLYQAEDGRVLGYGYTSTSGRVGPVAVREERLFPGVLGHLLGAVEPAGAFSAWVPGAAGIAMTALLEAGLRLEDFPALLCWDRPFADFSRYLPITLAVL